MIEKLIFSDAEFSYDDTYAERFMGQEKSPSQNIYFLVQYGHL